MAVTKLNVLFLVCVSAALSEVTCWRGGLADPRELAIRDLVSRTDSNSDGYLSLPELVTYFTSHDLNQDGVISQAEYVQSFLRANPRIPAVMAGVIARKIFVRMDKRDSDGVVTFQEMIDTDFLDENQSITVEAMVARIQRAMTFGGSDDHGTRVGAVAQMTDTNGDGYLSRDELRAAFARHDADEDGVITRQEWLRGVAARYPTSNPMAAGMANVLFDRIDTNGDGILESSEMIPDVASVDTDGDGMVSVDEFRTHMENTVHQGQQHRTLHWGEDGHGHENDVN